MPVTDTECPHCGGPAEQRAARYRCRRGTETSGRDCYPQWLNLAVEREAAAEIADYLRQLNQ